MRLQKWLSAAFRVGLSLGLLAGCATPQADGLLASPSELAARAYVERVPFHPQQRKQCGPASLAMALSASGDPVAPDELASQVFTPGRSGSFQADIVSATRRRGRVPYPVSDLKTLLMEVAAGSPVIVLQNLGLSWYAVWHYAVVVGYDLPRREIILRSGREPRKILSLHLFERTWKRSNYWGLVVLPPDRLPASAQEESYLTAVLGLERVHQWRTASQAYETARVRWPRSLGALMGLGNSRYALRDLPGAERAFRDATQLHPDAAPAFNNLAQVLAEQGRRDEAVAMARRAAALGGAFAPLYKQTLQEIEDNRR